MMYFVRSLLSDRIDGWANTQLDAHSSGFLHYVFVGLAWEPFWYIVILVVGSMAMFGVVRIRSAQVNAAVYNTEEYANVRKGGYELRNQAGKSAGVLNDVHQLLGDVMRQHILKVSLAYTAYEVDHDHKAPHRMTKELERAAKQFENRMAGYQRASRLFAESIVGYAKWIKERQLTEPKEYQNFRRWLAKMKRGMEFGSGAFTAFRDDIQSYELEQISDKVGHASIRLSSQIHEIVKVMDHLGTVSTEALAILNAKRDRSDDS